MEIIRPLLHYSKDEIKDILRKNKIRWWEDESNKNTIHTRNNIRTTLEGFSDYPLVRKRLAGVIDNLNRARDFIETENHKVQKRILNLTAKNATLDLAEYRKLHEELRLRILRDIIKKLSRTKKDIRMDSLKHLDNNLMLKDFKAAQLQGLDIKSKKLNKVIFN